MRPRNELEAMVIERARDAENMRDAAPEMLAVLKALADRLDPTFRPDGSVGMYCLNLGDLIPAIFAAIAKAEGAV